MVLTALPYKRRTVLRVSRLVLGKVKLYIGWPDLRMSAARLKRVVHPVIQGFMLGTDRGNMS